MPLHLANSVRAEKRKVSEWRRQRKRDTSARRSLVHPLMLISYLHLLRGPFLKAVTFLMLKQQTAFRPLDLHPPTPSLHLFSSVSLTCRKPAYRIRAINMSKKFIIGCFLFSPNSTSILIFFFQRLLTSSFIRQLQKDFALTNTRSNPLHKQLLLLCSRLFRWPRFCFIIIISFLLKNSILSSNLSWDGIEARWPPGYIANCDLHGFTLVFALRNRL